MCGIVGYVGARNAADILIDGLSNLEYRGYDSAGISLLKDGRIDTHKAQGRLQNLVERYAAAGSPAANCGIGHTRWATHGEPSDANAHPHFTDQIALVHNGIIENYAQLRGYLSDKGYAFTSDTDTEAAVKLIDHHYKGNPFTAITKALAEIEGSYALGIVFRDHPDCIYAVRKDSPLIVGLDGDGNFIASDVPAILQYTRNYYLLDEGEIALVRPDRVEVFDRRGNPIAKERMTAHWDIAQARKGGYPHFMLKEIHEQPKALRDTIHPRIRDSMPCFSADSLPADFFRKYEKIFFVACGTAMHAGTVGKAVIEKMARVPCEVDFASEFRYRDPIFVPGSLVIVISQSGETADTLAALRLARKQGIDTLAIVNVTGSSIAREADYVLHTYAGPEIAVASTKAFSVQVALLYLIALDIAREKGQLADRRVRELAAALLDTVEQTSAVIAYTDNLKAISGHFVDTHSLFYMGRGVDYSLAMEGSLKLKEISYIHSEAYAAGELKHGTISLITEGVPVVGLVTQSNLQTKTVSNIKEVRSRGGYVLLITRKDAEVDPDICDEILRLPDVEEIFLPLLSVIVLQLFAYYVAVARGCDVDKPRNLAKSVTVE